MKIRTRLILILSLATLAILSGFFFFIVQAQLEEENRQYAAKRDYYSRLIPSLYEIPFWNIDQEALTGTSTALLQDPDIESLRVTDSFGAVWFFRKKNSSGELTPIVVPVFYREKELGRIDLVFTNRAILDKIVNMSFRFIVMILVLLFTLNLIVMITAFSITRPLYQIVRFLPRIGSGNFEKKIPFQGKGELKLLISTINAMVDELKVREGAISRVTEFSISNKIQYELEKQKFELERTQREESEELRKRLQQSLEDLQQAQGQLIISEKMAVLGSLVAGIAHEINTPLGIGVTAASFLFEKVNSFISDVEAGTLKKSVFQEYLSALAESAQLVLLNLNKAADLIRSFKQVSVDQATDQKRNFDIGEYVREVIQSLRPKLKKTAHTIALECPKGLKINGYPGAFSQIFTNLIINSLTHGFRDQEKGEISIQILSENSGGGLRIRYSDNGRGLTEDELKHLFEPFYTTMRNMGGTGLGAYIIYNLVTQRLKGTIDAQSRPGTGLTYEIVIPAIPEDRNDPSSNGIP